MAYDDVRKKLAQATTRDDSKSERYNQIAAEFQYRYGSKPQEKKTTVMRDLWAPKPTAAVDQYVAQMNANAQRATNAYEESKNNLTKSWWEVLGNAVQSGWNATLGIQPSPEQGIRSAEAGQRLSAAVQAGDERGRLYKEMETANSAAQEARDYQQYVRLTEKYGSTDALAQDYADRIKAIEDEYREKPDQWRQARKQVKALEKEKQQYVDFLQSYETNLKNNQENAAVLDAWVKGNGGTYASYQLAQKNYDELDRRVTQLQNELTNAGAAEVDYSGYVVDDLSAAAFEAAKAAPKADTSKIQAQLEQAIREREQAKLILQYAQAHQADELDKAPDFELKAASGEEKFKVFKQEQQDELAAIRANPYADPNGFSRYDPQWHSEYREPDERWSVDEEKRFYCLFDDEATREQAYDYAININQKYNRGEAEDRDWQTREFATRSFGTGAMASAVSVPANLIGGAIDYTRMFSENLARGGVYETQYDGLSRWADTTRGAIAEKLNESGTIDKGVPVLGGKGLGDLYQLMMSMADSSVAVLAGGGPANAVFFGSAAASTTRDALERGIPGNRAVAMGFAAGAAEVAGETLSIEHLLKQGDIADYLRHGLLREMAKQGGVEASEEVLTTILNTLADAVINGDESELQQKVYVNVANGMSYADAVRKANKEWLEELGTDALGGFLSGGLMSGGRLALQSGAAAVTKYAGDAKGDLELARLTTEGSRSRSLADQYQQRLDKKGSITNLQAARLQAQTSADISAADRPALLRAAEARLRDQSTSKLTSGEYKRMAQDVVDGVLDGRTSKFSTALEQNVYEEMRMQIAGETVRTGNWLDDAGLKLTEARNAATKRMKMVETKDGEKVEVKNATMKDGELQLTIEQDGETKPVDLKDLKLDQYQMRALKTLTDTLGDDAAAAYNLMSGTGLQYGRASSIASYATAFGIIRDTFGRSADTEKAEAAALASSLRKGLTDKQVRYAVTIGQKRAKENGTLITREKSVWGTGKVTMDGGTLNDGTVLQGVRNKAQVLRSRQYAAVKAVAKALGIDVVLFESRADKDGNLTGAQGAYQDGVIYLDWNAGMNNIKATSERMLLRTMSHELTHFLQQNAPEDYEKLKNYVTSYLAEKMGENYRKLVMEKMANQPGLSYDGAIDEVVADSCETMLRDSQYVQQLIQEDRSFGQKIWDWIKSFFRKIEASDTGAKYMQATIDELREIWDSAMKNAVESRPDTETGVAEMSNAKGETVAVTSEETGGMQLSIRTYNEGGKQALRTFLDQQVKKGALTSQEATEIRSQIETLYQVCKDYDNGKYAPFSAWSNASVVSYDGRPVFSVVKANGEYKLNLDFSLVCKKRRTLDAVFNEMISQGIMDDFDMVQESIAKINDIIRENGFETACGLCFVDSKRYRQGMIADAFVGMYNIQVMSLVKSGAGQKVDYFNYGGDQTKQNTGHGIDTLPDDQLNWEKIDKILQTEKKTTVRWKIANYLKNNPSARRRVMRGDFMSTAGFDAVKAKNPELLSLYNSKKGAGGPKAAQSDVQYLNEIISQNMFNEKSAYEVGGVRIQSFSDYVGRLVFDYVQMVADLSAKKLPAHAYTKEFMFAQQFGLTGIKINMSLVPEVIKGGVAAGLDANGNYAWKDGQSFGSTVYDNKGKRLTAAEGFELAKRIQNAEGYSKNCGTIAVGVSDAHIRKMLDDPEIRMIIPYHKSSLNHIVAAMMNIDKYTDYTLQQNTRERKGSKWVNIPKGQEFNFNEALQRLGDAKAAANEYLAWCRENGYKPKFDQFADNANYYKVLEDFSCYDKDGVTNTPLSAVQMKFPGEGDAFGSMSELIEQGLEEDAILQAKQEQAVPEIVKQIQAVLPEFEGTVRERNAKKGSKKAATTGGKVQFATRQNPRTVTTEKVEELVRNCLYGIYDDNKYIPIRARTPVFFIDKVREDSDGQVEIAELPWAMVVWHVRQEVESQDDRDMAGEATPHAFLPDEFAEVIEKAEKPNKIILQNNGNYAMTVRHKSKAGKDIAVVISVGPENSGRFLYPQYMEGDYDGGFYNIAVTTYPIESFNQYYKKYVAENEDGQSGRIIYDKDASAEVGSRSTVPSRISGMASSGIIVPDTAEKSKGKVQRSMRGGTKTDTQLLRDLYDRIEAKVEARAKRNEAGLEKGYQKMVRDKQGVIYELQEEQRKALEKFHELSERYYEKEREVNAALQELDRLVQHSGSREQIQAQRAKVSAKEEQMAKALERLTQAKGGSEIQEILRQEREIQMQRTQDRIRDSIDRRDLRQRISKLWKELNARVTNPSEKKRIPVELMQQTLDVLEALNMDTSREGSKAGEKLRAKLDSLQARYRELQNDPDFRKAAVYDAQVAEYLTNMIAQVGDTPINKMSVAQMETVLETLKAMVYTANRALKLKLGEQELEAYEVSKAMTRETRSVEKPKTGFLSTWINAQLSPERMFNRLGGYSKDSYWGKVYGMLNEGQLKQTRLQMEGSLIFEDLMEKENEKNFQKFLDPKNTVDIGLKDENGEPVLITHGMMISLYMHLQNDQNRDHVLYGGLTIPSLKDYYNGKKVKGEERAVRVGGVLQEIRDLNERIDNTDDMEELLDLQAKRDQIGADYYAELMTAIEAQLTDYDRQWIAASRELFDGFSKRELNKTTLDVYGIKRANVENYFPIWVDGDFLNTPFETVAKDLSLENAGFMKERINSKKPIRLGDISDVASSQIRKVAQYCGLMPAIRGFNKVWGKTEQDYRDSLQKAVHETFGQAGVKYVENLMADLNGARGGQDSALGEFLNRMRGHMAQASLTMSLRVAMGQTASYPTAAAVVGWGPLMKALAHGGRNNTIISRADQELIRKWSPLLYYRLKGYSTTELGDIAGMNDKFSHLWKKARWLTGWIQAMDGATVGRLWYAAEYYVQDHNKALVKGTDAYYEAVAKVFNDIVEKTQPDYTTMQRPDILRSPNALVKQLTMFLTQRLQNFNILYDAAATYSKYKADFKAGRNGVTTEDVRQAGIATRRAVISQLAAAATITAFKFLADAILHSLKNYRDDDDELTKQSVSLEILDMFMDSLAGNVLGGGEIYDLIESKVFGKTYYGIEVSGLATVTDLVDAFSSAFDHALKAAKDDEYEYGREQILKDVDKLARNISTVAGIPYANGKKIAFGLFHHAQDIRNGAFLSYEAGVERSNAQQASRLYRAYTNGDGVKVKQILEEVPEDKQKDVYRDVRKLIREQQKSGELNVYEAMRQMKNYGGATDQVMAEYIKDLYEAGALPKADAEKYLQEYAGKTKEAAAKTVTNVDGKQASGVDYNDIDDMFKIGTMNAEEARKALVGYGIDKDTADMKVEYWSYQQKNPGTAMTTEDRFETYWKKYRPVGMTPSMYDDFYVQWNAVQGTDKDHDGKADRNSKKYERIAIIDSLPLSREQKDALFSMEWKTGLQDAPWNK